jgi:WD40 repeat protein
MNPHGTFGRRAGRAALLAAALIAVGACSDGLDVEIGDPSDPEADPVMAIVANQAGVWGNGRAVLARATGDGSSIVVTTTGIHTMTGDGTTVTSLHTFTEPTLAATMEVSPTGDTLVVATSTPSQLLWFDLATGELTAAEDLEVNDSITSISFLPDGIGLVAASPNGLAAWPDGPLSGPVALTDASAPTGSWAVLADGRVVAPLAGTTTLAVVDGLATSFVPFDAGVGANVFDAHATPAGDVVAITVGEGADLFERSDRILVLDPGTLAVRSEIAFDRALTPTDWALTDSHVAVGGAAGIDVFTLAGEPVAELATTSDRPLRHLFPLQSGFAAVHADGTVTAWDAAAWAPTPVSQDGVTIADASVDPGGSALTTVDFYGRLARWDLATGAPTVESTSFALGEATSVAVDADGLRVGVSSTSGRVAVLDRTLAEQWVFEPAPARVDTVEFQPASDVVTTGLAERTGAEAFDDTVASWDPATGAERFHVGGESEDVAGCAFFYNRIRFTGDGSLMATTSHDFSVAIVDSDTGGLVHRVPPRSSTILDLAYTPDDDLLVATSDDAAVTVLDTSDYSVAAEYQSGMGGFLAIAMLPDSATMAVSDITGGISLVDIMTGERLMEFADAAQRTSAIAVSADGTMLAAPADDAAIGIWSVDSGARLATLTGHTAPVTDVAFAPDGSWLVSSSLDATVRAWSITATR